MSRGRGVSRKRFLKIKAHFEKEARIFDKIFFKIMPCYSEMMQALIQALPFRSKERPRVVDLGCGTGNLSGKISDSYPKAQVTGVDMAENMLKMAQVKLGARRNISFWLGDMRDFDYSAKYDAIAASMVLHHIEKNDKLDFYRKLYNALSKKGVFYAIDIFLSPDKRLQKLYSDKWRMFMKINGLPARKIGEMIARHQKEDRPVALTQELSIMRRAGFRDIDVILKHYNFALYGGRK